jgi:prolipoprotein diacylglyceryl transferase
LAIYGGLIFGTLGAWIGARSIGVRFWSVADALAPAILVAQAIGRLGNYFNKELFGLPTDLPWGLEIPKANPAYPMGFPEGVLFHPTFLYEMIWNLLGFVVIVYWLERKFNLRNGRAFAVYLIYYSVGRAMIENIRIDNSEMLLGLRTNVWSAILTAAIGIGLLVWSNRKLPGTEESIWLPGKAPAELEFKDAANQSDDV